MARTSEDSSLRAATNKWLAVIEIEEGRVYGHPATEADLAGPLAPLSTVTQAPVLTDRVKPEYTPEMIENRISGVVQARLLVDTDGRVKDVEVTQDLGFGSRESAVAAFRKLRFKPAMRGAEPVAVWIRMKYRFVLQE